MADHTQAVLTREGDRATVTFRTESGINVASTEFLEELEKALDELAGDRELRMVVFRGDGKVFLAGANIKAMAKYEPALAKDMSKLGHRVFNKLEALPQVTIAAVHGAALGGGCELAMACDFRFVLNRAPMGQPEVHLGLIPGWGGTIRLPRLVPHGIARRLLYTGESVTGERAVEIGLADEVVESVEALDEAIEAMAKSLAKSGREAIGSLKRALVSGDEQSAFSSCFGRHEGKEGMRAFLEKRRPEW